MRNFRVLNRATGEFSYAYAGDARVAVIIARGQSENVAGTISDWIEAYDNEVVYESFGLIVATGNFATGVN